MKEEMYVLDKHKAIQNEDGNWVIFDVPIFAETSKDGIDFNEEWLNKAVQLAQERFDKDRYMPPLHEEHNSIAPTETKIVRKGLGKFLPKATERREIEGEERCVIIADILVSPDVFRQIQDQKYPYLSIETGNKNRPEIASMAALTSRAPEIKGSPLMVSPVYFSEDRKSWQFAKGGLPDVFYHHGGHGDAHENRLKRSGVDGAELKKKIMFKNIASRHLMEPHKFIGSSPTPKQKQEWDEKHKKMLTDLGEKGAAMTKDEAREHLSKYAPHVQFAEEEKRLIDILADLPPDIKKHSINYDLKHFKSISPSGAVEKKGNVSKGEAKFAEEEDDEYTKREPLQKQPISPQQRFSPVKLPDDPEMHPEIKRVFENAHNLFHRHEGEEDKLVYLKKTDTSTGKRVPYHVVRSPSAELASSGNKPNFRSYSRQGFENPVLPYNKNNEFLNALHRKGHTAEDIGKLTADTNDLLRAINEYNNSKEVNHNYSYFLREKKREHENHLKNLGATPEHIDQMLGGSHAFGGGQDGSHKFAEEEEYDFDKEYNSEDPFVLTEEEDKKKHNDAHEIRLKRSGTSKKDFLQAVVNKNFHTGLLSSSHLFPRGHLDKYMKALTAPISDGTGREMGGAGMTLEEAREHIAKHAPGFKAKFAEKRTPLTLLRDKKDVLLQKKDTLIEKAKTHKDRTLGRIASSPKYEKAMRWYAGDVAQGTGPRGGWLAPENVASYLKSAGKFFADNDEDQSAKRMEELKGMKGLFNGHPNAMPPAVSKHLGRDGAKMLTDKNSAITPLKSGGAVAHYAPFSNGAQNESYVFPYRKDNSFLNRLARKGAKEKNIGVLNSQLNNATLEAHESKRQLTHEDVKHHLKRNQLGSLNEKMTDEELATVNQRKGMFSDKKQFNTQKEREEKPMDPEIETEVPEEQAGEGQNPVDALIERLQSGTVSDEAIAKCMQILDQEDSSDEEQPDLVEGPAHQFAEDRGLTIEQQMNLFFHYIDERMKKVEADRAKEKAVHFAENRLTGVSQKKQILKDLRGKPAKTIQEMAEFAAKYAGKDPAPLSEEDILGEVIDPDIKALLDGLSYNEKALATQFAEDYDRSPTASKHMTKARYIQVRLPGFKKAFDNKGK
jgi:hypothetical protein